MVEVSPKQSVKVANHPSGQSVYLSLSDARRLVKRGGAKFDRCGQLMLDPVEMNRRRNLNKGAVLIVQAFSGLDAFPDRPVMPPSPSVLQRMRSYRGPLVPPLRPSFNS